VFELCTADKTLFAQLTESLRNFVFEDQIFQAKPEQIFIFVFNLLSFRKRKTLSF
jgi:hypothetical protein